MMIDVQGAVAVNLQSVSETRRKCRNQHDENFSANRQIASLPAHVVKKGAANQKFFVDAALVFDYKPFNFLRRPQTVRLVGNAHCKENFLLFGVQVRGNIFAVVDANFRRHRPNKLQNPAQNHSK